MVEIHPGYFIQLEQMAHAKQEGGFDELLHLTHWSYWSDKPRQAMDL